MTQAKSAVRTAHAVEERAETPGVEERDLCGVDDGIATPGDVTGFQRCDEQRSAGHIDLPSGMHDKRIRHRRHRQIGPTVPKFACYFALKK